MGNAVHIMFLITSSVDDKSLPKQRQQILNLLLIFNVIDNNFKEKEFQYSS